MKVHIVCDAKDMEEVIRKARELERNFNCECAVTVSWRRAEKKEE